MEQLFFLFAVVTKISSTFAAHRRDVFAKRTIPSFCDSFPCKYRLIPVLTTSVSDTCVMHLPTVVYQAVCILLYCLGLFVFFLSPPPTPFFWGGGGGGWGVRVCVWVDNLNHLVTRKADSKLVNHLEQICVTKLY